MTVIGLVCVTPFLMMIVASFNYAPLFMAKLEIWLPNPWTLSNYEMIFANQNLWKWLLNSMVITVIPVITTVLTGALVGYLFAKKQFRFKNTIFWLFMSVLMIPAQMTLIPRYILYDSFGWIDTYTAFLVPGFWSVIYMFFFRQYIKTLPNAFLESAKLDGCGEWRTFYLIILPLCKTICATVATLTFIDKWNDFMNPLIFTTKPEMYNMTVGLSSMIQQDGFFSIQMATGTLTLVPLLLVYISFQRYFTDGIAMGGVKG